MTSVTEKRDTLFIPYMMSAHPDPLNIFWSGDWAVANHLWSTLVTLGADGTPAAQLASSWSVSPDQRVWTFSLRRGLKWSDGTSITTEHVIASLNSALKGTSHSDLSSAVETISDQAGKVQFQLRKPIPTLLVTLSYVDWAIVHPATVDHSGIKPKLKTLLPVSGHYFLKSPSVKSSPVHRTELERNKFSDETEITNGALENYHECSAIVQQQDRALGFRGYREDFSPDCQEKLAKNFNLTQLAPTWILSARITPGGEKRLPLRKRQAILVALQEKLKSDPPKFGVRRATGILPSYLFGALKEEEFDSLLSELKKTSRGASSTDSVRGLTVRLVTMESWGKWESFAWLSRSLQLLGVKLETHILPRADYFEGIGTPGFNDKFDLNFIPFGVGDPDPDGAWRMTSRVFSSSGPEPHLIANAFFETNQEKRAQLYKELAKRFLSKAVFFPLMADAPLVGVHKSFKLRNVNAFNAGLTLQHLVPANQ